VGCTPGVQIPAEQFRVHYLSSERKYLHSFCIDVTGILNFTCCGVCEVRSFVFGQERRLKDAGECLGRCEWKLSEEGERIIKWRELCNFLLSLNVTGIVRSRNVGLLGHVVTQAM